MTTKQFKHLLVAYTDTTGGKTWGVLEPGLRSRFPIKELAWNKYLIRQLEITFVDSKDKTVQSLISVDEPHKMPFFYMLILDGDEDSRDSKTETRKFANEWMSKEGDDPWLIVVVQKSYQQSKIFKYQLAEKLRSDVQAQYRPRICSVKVNEGQNEEQWIELMNRIKETLVASLDLKVAGLTKTITKADGSASIDRAWNFFPYFKAKECLAILYEKANLFDLALLQYIEVEKAFYQHMRAEARTKKVDKCFSAAKFSESSSSRLIGGDDLEYESLHMGRISRFDFHQYVVSNQFNLLLKLSMPELALMRAYSFITATHKYLSAQFNRENPMFVDGWVFSAALAASNTCNFYISCTKSDNSHSESYLKIADMFLEARNELKRFGLSRGLLDSSASSTFGMLKAAFAMTGNNFEPSPQQVEAINTVVTAATDDVTTTGTESEQQQKEEASSVPPKKLDDTEGYMNEPNTDYITKALEDYMSSAHKQILSSSMPPSSGTTGQQDQNQGQQQQQQQLPQPLSNSTSSRRVSFNFKMRSSHSTTLELQRGISSGSPGSGDETPRSAKRSVFASPAAVAAAAALTSVRSCKNSVDDEMLAIEQFYATVPPPPPLPQDKDDLARFKDNPILVDALKSVESFDSILIGVSEKAQKAYNMANRPRASLNLFCEVALLYFLRKKWTEAEALLGLITDTLKGWKNLSYAFLELLCHAQYENKNYKEFVGSCLRLLSSTSLDSQEEKHRKCNYVEKLLDVARNSLTIDLKKKVESAFIQFSLMLDEEVTDVVKEVLVGEKVELGCRVNNKLLHEIGADKVEIVFVSKEDSKVKFRIGVHTEGTEQVTLKPGNDNVFTFSGASPSAGTFSLNSLAITAGKLTIKRPYRGEQNVTVTVATTPPSATFVATFPKWMPKDKEQQPYNVNFIIKANKDKLSNISLELNTDAIFRVANLTGPNGKEFPVEKGNVVNLGETIECGEDVVLSAPIDYDKLRKTNKVSAKLVFQTALSGGACCLSQAVTVRCSDPFTFTFWQAAFKGNSVLVQIQLQSKATVPLRVLACKIAPAAGKTALEGTIYSLGTKGQPFETVYRVADGFADVEEDDSSVVMPGHVFGTAYVFQKPPKFTETWNFSVKYEFEPFSTKKQPSPPAASGVDALIRTFTSPFNMGFFSPEYTATLSFPQAVTVGEMFNMVIRVTPSLSQQYHQQYPSASTEPEEKEKCNEEKKRAKKVMMLRVSLPAPEQFVQQGYSSRVIEFMDGDNREQTFRVGFIPLQMGELLVPTVEITDVDSEFNKARILSEHPVVLSLSSKQYFMSCESQTAPRPPGNSVASSTSKRSVEPFYVLWVHTPAGAEAAKDKDCTQVIKSAVAKLKQQVALDITHYTYTEWLRCRAQAMEEKTFRKIIVDGDSRLASRVLLYTKQREKYTDTPIVILTEDTIKSWSEFSQLSNVRTIHNYDQLFETLVENPFIASSGQGTASTDIASTQGSSMPTSDGGKAKGSSGGHRLTKSSSFPIKPSKKN